METKSENNCPQNEMKTLKNFKSMAEFNATNQTELIRGETPVDIVDTCLQLCKQYLSGVWTQQTVDTIHVRRIPGGLTNQMYYCGIKSVGKESPQTGVPREVAIRLYGRKESSNDLMSINRKLNDAIVGLIVSANGLGPRVYGTFNGGQILAYYKHRHFGLADQNRQQMVRQLFEGLARVHAMDVPVRREHWFHRLADDCYLKIQNCKQTQTLVNELNLNALQTHSLKAELDFVKQLVDKCDSPMVFCHNSLRAVNIMVVENSDCSINDNSDERVLFCDYESSSYGYRGYDLALVFSEWAAQKANHFPSDSTLIPLIEIYVNECRRVLGNGFTDSEINSVQHILIEVKVFTLVCGMKGTLTLLKNNPDAGDALDMDKKLTTVCLIITNTG